VLFYVPFVMNTKEEIVQPLADYQAGPPHGHHPHHGPAPLGECQPGRDSAAWLAADYHSSLVNWIRLPQVSFSMAMVEPVTLVGGMVNCAPRPCIRSYSR
jgi:hypothetical protein